MSSREYCTSTGSTRGSAAPAPPGAAAHCPPQTTAYDLPRRARPTAAATRAYEGLRGALTTHTSSLAAPPSAQAEHATVRSIGAVPPAAAEFRQRCPAQGRSVARMARTADANAAAAELLDAIDKGDSAAVGALLRTEAGRAAADVVCGEPETTPLLAAVKGEHTAIVSLLLEASADPDRVPSADPNGEPPGDSPLQHAAAEGYLVRTRRCPVVPRRWPPSSCRASSADSRRMDCA